MIELTIIIAHIYVFVGIIHAIKFVWFDHKISAEMTDIFTVMAVILGLILLVLSWPFIVQEIRKEKSDEIHQDFEDNY